MDGLAINLGQMIQLQECTPQHLAASSSLEALLSTPALQLHQRCRPTGRGGAQPTLGVGWMDGSPGTFANAVTDDKVRLGDARWSSPGLMGSSCAAGLGRQ